MLVYWFALLIVGIWFVLTVQAVGYCCFVWVYWFGLIWLICVRLLLVWWMFGFCLVGLFGFAGGVWLVVVICFEVALLVMLLVMVCLGLHVVFGLIVYFYLWFGFSLFVGLAVILWVCLFLDY